MSLPMVPCFRCEHYIGRRKEHGYKCKAFDDIPDLILFEGNQHDKPLKNQGNKIVFKLSKKISL